VTGFKTLVLQTYGPVCFLCGGAIDVELHHNQKMAATVHHLIPKVRLDPSQWFDVETVRPAHRSCNSSAGDRVFEGSCPVHGSSCGVSRHSRDW
jgi:5-methylcytosine-specific restriction endonuclease McrA